jgi:hypothetical protein
MTLGNSRAAALAAVLVAAAWAGTAAAETPEDAGGRYTMSPVDGGFLRLDKETGAVSMCAGPNGQWTCKPVEDRAVVAPSRSEEVARLEEENKALKERVKALEESLETGKPAPPPNGPLAGPPGGKIDLPTEQEVDQALDYMERVYKKLRDRIKDLDKPLPPPADGAPGPGKSTL